MSPQRFGSGSRCRYRAPLSFSLPEALPLSDHKQEADPGLDDRVESGIARLDYILKGGFLRGGMYAIYGPPGAGKTMMATQFCFNHVKGGGRCVYFTVLTESHSKLVRHLKPMSFFDPTAIGHGLKFIAAYQTLKDEGVHGFLQLVQRTLAQEKPSVIVIDGLESVEQIAGDAQHAREFLHQLQGFAFLTGTTTLLCAVSEGPRAARLEDALVDGVIELSDQLVGPRAVRELTVHKFRGSDYLRGRHETEITDGGLQIHPRTEVQFDDPPASATEQRVRQAFGVPGLDSMMEGGIPSGSSVALLGAPGAGKTTLGLGFLIEGAKRGNKGIYFGFYEPPPRLMEKAAALGLPLEEHVKSGMIELIWQPPLEHFMDSLAESLLEKVRSDQHDRRRLFIDGIEGFRSAAVYPERIPRFLSALTNQLRTYDVTTVVSEELPLFRAEVDMPNPEMGNVVETVLLLRYVELKSQLYRLVSIMKMRESRYDTSIRQFEITGHGVDVQGSFETAEAILSGLPRSRGGEA
ncbi:RAD55 family ATPase [Ramlibacter sp. MMS24-I3-19]|uniref:RAD55 family ATPase n=1 Tax=Ramlibacter sp. MMS24-I3-19 TaxID=3416606 RepID=UPI003CFC8839